MKRIGNLYGKVCSLENLRLADAIAREGKRDQYGVRTHDRNAEANLSELRDMLMYKEYSTSPYKHFIIHDPKEREISCLPYYPDRIVHHAVMNILEPIFVSVFTSDTYSCIKGRGIHSAKCNLEKALRDQPATKYCLQLDIKKFYPSINHNVLKQQLRRKIKDEDLLWLLYDIIDSAPGVPIGNYLSQFFANFNMTPFDHWIKEEKKAPYYFRYSDDMIILSDSKPWLHMLLAEIRNYLWDNLRLQVKSNYQVFPVDAQGIDFVGYEFYHGYTLMRKSIKKRFAKAVSRGASAETINSYMGWACHCNSNNLIKKLFAAT